MLPTKTHCFDLISKRYIPIVHASFWVKEAVLEQTAFFNVNGCSFRFRIVDALEAGILKPEDIEAPKTKTEPQEVEIDVESTE